MKKKPTGSANFFKNPENVAAPAITNPVLKNLVSALPPGVELPASSSPAVVPIQVDLNRIQIAALPKAPMMDNALELPSFPNSAIGSFSAPAAEPKAERVVWPIPTIEELQAMLTDLDPELLEKLVAFKKYADIEGIEDPTRDHADYGPSSAERVVNCQASSALQYLRKAPATTTSYASEGHLAHEIAEEAVAAKFEKRIFDPTGKFGHSKYKKEMFEHGQAWAEYCHKACEQYLEFPFTWAVEERVCVSSLRDSWGTLDFCFVARVNGKLFAVVCDYKYGAGVDVASENEQTGWKNWQLALYALGVIGKFLRIENENRH